MSDQFGIGPALRSLAAGYFAMSRRTGRTTRLIESLPEKGAMVVFLQEREALRVKRLCSEAGKQIYMVVADSGEQLLEKLRGNRSPVYFDHGFVERLYMDALEGAEDFLGSLNLTTHANYGAERPYEYTPYEYTPYGLTLDDWLGPVKGDPSK